MNLKDRLEKIQEWMDSHKEHQKIAIPDEEGFSFKKLLAFAGPGLLVSIAYVDPGNFTTDITAGAQFNYRLIWVLIAATFVGLILQILTSRLGLVTGKHLAQVCKDEYGDRTPLTIILWLITESAIIASDIPEVVGTAFALNMLFGIPLWAGVLITGVDTMLFLGLQNFGVRYLEIFIGALVAIISCCFVVELGLSPVDWVHDDCPTDWCQEFANQNETCPTNYCGTYFGGFVPRLTTENLYIAVSLLGAVVMPHNLYLHSALVLSRGVNRRDKKAIKEANIYNWIECAGALAISAFINVSIVAVSAAIFYPDQHNDYSTDNQEPDLDDTSKLLGNTLGSGAKVIFGIALLASGQSSTLTGTYAGQFVMEGFLELKMSMWKRNLITRSIAILPSLIVALLAGQSGSSALIILSSAILSFQLPFALIPLIKFTSSEIKMGEFANSRAASVLLGGIAATVVSANVYLIYATLFASDGAITSLDDLALKIILSILVGVIGIFYFGFLAYLTKRPVTVASSERPEDRPLLAVSNIQEIYADD